MQGLDLVSALDLTARLVACGLVFSALEMLSHRAVFSPRGVFSLGVVSPFHTRLLALERTDRFLGLILGLQAVASAGLAVIGPFSLGGRLMLTAAFLAAMTVRWRRQIGGDGAEQMAMLVLLGTALAVLPAPSSGRVTLAVWFIAAQLCLSYAVAGIAKLVSPVWRNGQALPAILSTHSHGHPWAAGFLSRRPWAAKLASWSVILFECAFPLLLLGPGWMVIAALVVGFAFHVACAVLMGLNSFLWSFPATYPCVLALWMVIRG